MEPFLDQNGITRAEIASALGMDPSTVSRKASGSRFWKHNEIKDLLGFLSSRLSRPVTFEEVFGLSQDDSAGDRTIQVGARDGGPLEDEPDVVGVVNGSPVTNASRTAPTGSAVPVAQDDSAADRPTAGNPVLRPAGEPPIAGETNDADVSPVYVVNSAPPAGALPAGAIGAQGHTQPSAPTRAHTSGGLAPDTVSDPSAVDVPVAPCEGD